MTMFLGLPSLNFLLHMLSQQPQPLGNLTSTAFSYLCGSCLSPGSVCSVPTPESRISNCLLKGPLLSVPSVLIVGSLHHHFLDSCRTFYLVSNPTFLISNPTFALSPELPSILKKKSDYVNSFFENFHWLSPASGIKFKFLTWRIRSLAGWPQPTFKIFFSCHSALQQ